nr:4406_t:CDS:2 [Entrophospora candida]
MYSPSRSGVPPLQPANSNIHHNEYRGEYPPPHLHPLHDEYYQSPQLIPPRPNNPTEEREESQRRSSSSGSNEKNKHTTRGTQLTPLPRTRFKKERFAAFEPHTYAVEAKRSYSLLVCQQPLRARMCGFGEKDRRPIDPPPIVQLLITDSNGHTDNSMIQNPFFVLHVTLWSEDGREERNVISSPPKTTRVLMGSLVSSPAILKNTLGQQGCYFCFPDLSIRTEGKYTLRFSLMKLGSEDRLIDTKTEIIATVFSEPFTVYSAKKFPGMTESTELSKAFAKQGLKIPIRNDVRPRKAADDG